MNHINDLSSDEDSPTMNLGERSPDSFMGSTSATAFVQGFAAMNLAGCFAAEDGTHGGSSHNFATMVLTAWTLCLGAYAWWWLRDPHTWNMPQPAPEPMVYDIAPAVQEDSSSKGPQVEGLMHVVCIAASPWKIEEGRAVSQQRQHHEVPAKPVLAC